jgi:release factor glutamine methyltransferase
VTAKPETWTTRRLLAWMTDAFKKKGMASPQLQARLLMSHVIGCDDMRLFLDPDRPATELERGRLRDLVGRALKDEPVQYLIGEWRFFGLPFRVDKRVLIPRPSTETIVEHVLQHTRAEPGFGGKAGEGVLIADVCTGSGNIAISLLKNLTGARAVAADVSAGALEVARENAAKLGVSERIDFLEGDLLAPLAGFPGTRGPGTLHYLVSNPPYIPDDEWGAVAANVKNYEPTSALRGGVDGMVFVRPLIERGPAFLRPGGLILVEDATARAAEAQELMRARPEIAWATVLDDVEGLPRVVVGRRG